MTYKYYTITASGSLNTPNQNLLNEFQALVNSQFEVASNLFTVQEEATFGSNVYSDVVARVDTVVDAQTGTNKGDDFKKIIFKDLGHAVGLGVKYYFDSNYWITTFSEKIKTLSSSATVRRCNNVLNWVDENGNIFSEPCIIDYTEKRNVNQVGSINPVTPEGYISIYAQLNTKTRKIFPNQRFIFGNTDKWTSLYIFGFGVRNFDNLTTFNNDSAQLLTLEAGVSYANADTDNFSLGIANYYKNTYSLSPTPATISGSAGNSVQIVPNVLINDIAVSRPMSYISSSSAVATVSGSGLVNLISNGSATISLYVTSNISASATIPVVISASATTPYEIRILPADNFVLEGDTASISIYGYQNSTQTSDSFTFTLADSNVPTDNYTLTVVDGNHITVKNILMYMSAPLLINAVSGSNNKQISLTLKGAW